MPNVAGRAFIVQLPFPSFADPHPLVVAYYRDYSRVFAQLVEGYDVPENQLWELPLWVCHIGGMLAQLGRTPQLVDLSAKPATTEACLATLLATTWPGDVVMLSPLAQNFDLALEVSRGLNRSGRRTVLGGNMASLASARDATVVHRGQATPQSLARALSGGADVVEHRLTRGQLADWKPDYDLLADFRGRVPLLRLNASHGCLYRCEFCGDAWSNSLSVVSREVLEYEVEQFERLFPETRLIYIGDKTFGQSREAIANLLEVFATRPGYRFIVQTHALAVDSEVLDAMEALGVVAVEMGFESASSDLLRANRKGNRTVDFYLDKMERVAARGMKIVLNVLSGLPTEGAEAHEQTVEFIARGDSPAWLYNLYNFVPYPLTPVFPSLRERIVDWNFANWREDALPVFEPYHSSREESFEFFLDKVRAAHAAITRVDAPASESASAPASESAPASTPDRIGVGL